MTSFVLTATARRELDAIWIYIARHSPSNADHVENAIRDTCRLVARDPQVGHPERNLSSRDILFFTVSEFPNYSIAYQPGTRPLRILRIRHGAQIR